MKTGRPRKFKSESDFVASVTEYMTHCDNERKLPNIAGYCIFANINRDTFYAYQHHFPDTFKKVNDILEDAVLTSKHVSDTMKIFYLKNKFQYKDRYDQVTTGTQEVTIKRDMKQLTNEELEQLLTLTNKIENE